jgi:hypothetical protein
MILLLDFGAYAQLRLTAIDSEIIVFEISLCISKNHHFTKGRAIPAQNWAQVAAG